MRKINFKSLLFHLFVPLMLSFIISMLIGDYSSYYNSIVKPVTVPSIVFPIVWTILYLLMGVSAYIVDNSDNPNSDKAMKFYYIQLFYQQSYLTNYDQYNNLSNHLIQIIHYDAFSFYF